MKFGIHQEKKSPDSFLLSLLKFPCYSPSQKISANRDISFWDLRTLDDSDSYSVFTKRRSAIAAECHTLLLAALIAPQDAYQRTPNPSAPMEGAGKTDSISPAAHRNIKNSAIISSR